METYKDLRNRIHSKDTRGFDNFAVTMQVRAKSRHHHTDQPSNYSTDINRDRRSTPFDHYRTANNRDNGRSKSLAPEDFRKTGLHTTPHRSYYGRSSPSHYNDRSRSRSVSRYHRSPSVSSNYYRGRYRSPLRSQHHSSDAKETDYCHRLTNEEEYRRYDRTHDRRSSPEKQLFLAVNHKTVGLMMGNEYDVLDIDERKTASIVVKSSWTLRIAMYPKSSKEDSYCSSNYTIHRYSASKYFTVKVIKHLLNQRNVKLYTTLQTTKNMDKILVNTEEYKSLKETIRYLDSKKLYECIILKPQRRSSVCLFRKNCNKSQDCVYCQLEALNNNINVHSGIRATKQTDVADKDRGVLDKMVVEVASRNRSRTRSRSSSSSSSTSSSSSSSSSEEEEVKTDHSKPKEKTEPVDEDVDRQKGSQNPKVMREASNSCEDILKIDTDFDPVCQV